MSDLNTLTAELASVMNALVAAKDAEKAEAKAAKAAAREADRAIKRTIKANERAKAIAAKIDRHKAVKSVKALMREFNITESDLVAA